MTYKLSYFVLTTILVSLGCCSPAPNVNSMLPLYQLDQRRGLEYQWWLAKQRVEENPMSAENISASDTRNYLEEINNSSRFCPNETTSWNTIPG